jgi:hypothetical protein
MSSVLSNPDSLDPGNKDFNDVPEWFMNNLRNALASPLFSVPKPFETWMVDRVATAGFPLAISQIVGFGQYAARIDRIQTSESTDSTTYTDLATVGPTLTNLPSGSYLLLYSAVVADTGFDAYVSPKVNSTEADDADALILSPSTIPIGGLFAAQKNLSLSGPNTVTLRYKSPAASTTSFSNRVLVALRTGNL